MTIDTTAISKRIDDLRDKQTVLEERDTETTTDQLLLGAKQTSIIAEIHHLTAIRNTIHGERQQ